MYLNGIPQYCPKQEPGALIIEKVGSRRNIPFSIIADTDTRHGMVVMSMDTVSQLGFERLSISAVRLQVAADMSTTHGPE